MDVKNKIILFEGFDNTGKTTIAKELSKLLRFQYFKNPAEKERFGIPDLIDKEAMIEARYLVNLLEQVFFEGLGIIFDRNIPSHFVYSKAFNRKFNLAGIIEIDKKLAELGAVIIFCYKTKILNYSDSLVDESKSEQVNSLYYKYFSMSKMKYLFLNTDDEDLKRQINTILSFLGLRRIK